MWVICVTKNFILQRHSSSASAKEQFSCRLVKTQYKSNMLITHPVKVTVHFQTVTEDTDWCTQSRITRDLETQHTAPLAEQPMVGADDPAPLGSHWLPTLPRNGLLDLPSAAASPAASWLKPLMGFGPLLPPCKSP